MHTYPHTQTHTHTFALNTWKPIRKHTHTIESDHDTTCHDVIPIKNSARIHQQKQQHTPHRTGAQMSASFEQANARTATMTSLPLAPPERCVSVRMLEANFLAKQPAVVCGRPGCRVCAIREHSGRRPTRHSVLVTYTVLLEHDVQPKTCI